MNAIVITIRFLFSHKWKIILTFLLSLIFLIILFPLSDLNDLISSQVSKLTNNRIFLQLEKIHLNPITPSVSIEKLYVETPQISSITSDDLEIAPSISALIARKPGGKITATGFLKGTLTISMHPAPSEKGLDKSKIEITASNISLKEARQMANINFPVKGELSLNSQALVDLTLTEQPELDLNLSVAKFELAPSFVPLSDFGQILLPEIKLGKIELKGRLANGKFLIESGKLGTNSDELYGEIKGELSITLQNSNGFITPILGAYSVSIDLKATQIFKNKAKLFLSFLDGYKVDAGSLSSYKFKISSSEMGMPPQFAPLK